MPDAKISALTAVTTPELTDEFAVNQGGVSKKMTLAQLKTAERYLLRANATRALTSSTAEQKLFGDPTNGRLTLPVGLYLFEATIYLTGMSSTSGNFAFAPKGAAGTAVIADVIFHAVGIDSSTPTSAATQTGSFTISNTSAGSIVVAATGTGAGVRIEGMFEVTTAGTMVPSVTLVTAAAATVGIGTYFMAERISEATNVVSIGPAD